LTGSAQVLTRGSNQFANGTQTTQITTSLNYAMDSNVNIFDTVTGALEIQVNCEWVCKITCCLKALNNRMESQRCSNYPAFLQTKDIFTQVMSKVTLIMQLISCGEEAEVSSIITQIQELANCTDDCCGKDTPSLVGGLNGGTSAAISVVQSGGSPVTVTDVTVGDTTTYTITLDPAFITTVSNSYNTVLANGGGITWTDSGVVAGVRTYTPSLSIPSQNMMAFKVNMVFSTAHTGFATITVLNPQISGSTFQTPTVSTLQVSPQLTDFNCFVVNNFFVGTPNNNYKVYATMEIKDSNPTGGVSFEGIRPLYLYDYTSGPQTSGSFMFRLDGKDTSAVTIYEDLGAIGFNTTINFLIIA
jgi:hypothetical protein